MVTGRLDGKHGGRGNTKASLPIWLQEMPFLPITNHGSKSQDKLIDNVLKAQDTSGYIGIYDEECRLDNILNENGELWTQSRMINAILAYYEFTGNAKYLKAAKRAVDYTIERYEKSGKTYFQQPKPNGGGLTHGLNVC